MSIVFESLRPLEGIDFWLFRIQEQPHLAWRLAPFVMLQLTFVTVIPTFFGQVNATQRLIAHSGLLGDWQVLPAEANTWPPGKIKRSLAALALSNPNLEDLYARGDGTRSSGGQAGSSKFGGGHKLIGSAARRKRSAASGDV